MNIATRIHHLTADDLPLLRQLNAVFAEAFGDAKSYLATPPSEAYCRRLLGQPNVIALVAEQAGSVVGGLVAYELQKLESERSEVYIYDLAVAEAHRRQGIATALIARVRAIAHERGAWVAFVQADHGDDPAIALYTRLGTREDVMHFDLPVP
jgi:aminoglycoside 3-N-acetyltransferase I